MNSLFIVLIPLVLLKLPIVGVRFYYLLCNTGIEHKVWYTFCDCEPIAVTLTRASLWPSTPHNPRYAFTFALLDWAEALMLECQVALKDFCGTLKFKCPLDTSKVH